MSLLGDITGGVLSGGLDILGGQLDAAQNRQSMRFNRDMQEDFAKHGIQWRVEDAKSAGIHPLAALGMMPAQSSPVVIGSNVGAGLKDAGQAIGSAITRSQDTDARAFENAQLEKLHADTALVHTQRAAIASEMGLKQQAAGAAIGLGIQPETPGDVLPAGQVPNSPLDRAGSGFVDIKPAPRISSSKGVPFIESGISPDLERVEMEGGLVWLAPSTRGQESPMEVWGEMPWYEKLSNLMRNQNYWSKHGYDNWWNDFLKVKGGYDIDGPVGITHYSNPGALLTQGMKDAIRRATKQFPMAKGRFNQMKKSWENRVK